MTKHQISNLLDELKSNETFIRNDSIKKIIKNKINDEQIVVALKYVIENDSSMSVRNFARAALDVLGVEHSEMEHSIIETESLKIDNKDTPVIEEKETVLQTENIETSKIAHILAIVGIVFWVFENIIISIGSQSYGIGGPSPIQRILFQIPDAFYTLGLWLTLILGVGALLKGSKLGIIAIMLGAIQLCYFFLASMMY